MREFTKNLFSFGWAMSLFGLKQLGNVLNPQETLRGAPNAAKSFDSVTDAVVDQFGRTLRQTFEAGDRVQGEIVDLMFGFLGVRPDASRRTGTGTGTGAVSQAAGAVAQAADTLWSGVQSGLQLQPAIFNAQSSAGEEVLITYTRGRGQFSDNKQFIALTNPIYNLDGTENGLHEGVWQAMFKSPGDLLARPAPPTGSMFEPVGPVPGFPISANTIAKWTHADGSSISSVGPAASHLIPLSDGSFLFLVITGQIITEGTGRFAGARGLTQSLGATWVPAGTNLFSPQGPTTFPALTFDTFKLVRTSSPFESQAVGQSNAEPAACAVTANPGDSRFVEVLGSRMHYIDTGSGEPILFLHGNPAWSYLWRKVLPHVSPTARCIAPDLIGMGLSDKPPIEYTYLEHVRYVEGFIAALGLDRYTMVLHDWGCIIGFYIAMRQEARVRGIAFMEAMLGPYASWSAFPKDIAAQFQAFRAPGVGEQLIIQENLFIDRLLPASTLVPLTDEEMACYRRPFLDPDSRKVILTFARQLPVGGQPADVAKATGEYAAWLKRTRMPKLFLWSDPGLITHEKDVDWARRNFKNLKTSFLGPGLHFAQEEHPVEIGQEVARWHEEILRAPAPAARARR